MHHNIVKLEFKSEMSCYVFKDSGKVINWGDTLDRDVRYDFVPVDFASHLPFESGN